MTGVQTCALPISAFAEALDRMSAQAPPPQRTEAFLAGVRKEIST